MRGTFDDEELAPVKARRDTELTLGSGALLAIFLGLALLCVFCFGLGYAVGHRGSTPIAALPVPSQPLQAGNPIAKPPATAQPDQSQTPDADDAGQSSGGAASGANASPNAQVVPAAATADAAPGQPAVHPALAAGPAAAPSAQAPPAAGVQPAVAQSAAMPSGSPPAGSLMVQIAAVSHPEDAEVLTDALRKRGYPVTARRDPADNLIHVRVGPFATLAEANSWRMKLLNDGYNAILQQ